MMNVSTLHDRAKAQRGFTRTDLIATLAAACWLGLVLYPAWAAVPAANQAKVCADNLRRIGQAFHQWAGNHGDKMPWRVSFEDGGLYDMPARGNAWVHFAWLSNHLATPKVLACPADSVRPASSFTRKPDGGLLHVGQRGNSVSYFVGVDAHAEGTRSLLSGDGHLTPSDRGQTCEYANINTASSLGPGEPEVGWKASLHNRKGQVLQFDGSVLMTTSQALRKLLPKTEAVHEANHVLLPR